MSRSSLFRNSSIPAVLAALALGASSCARDEALIGAMPDSVALATAVDSGTPITPPAADTIVRPFVALPPLADTIAQRLVFAPVVQNWFAAAARGKRLVVDLGRIDIDLKKDPARVAAFRLAAEARSPVPKGTLLRIRGPWGADDVTVTGFDTTAGRVVATVRGPPRVDSLAASVDPLIAAAERVQGGSPAVTSACDRTVDSAFQARLTSLADSVETVLRSGDQPIYPRLQKAMRARRSVVAGCFGTGRGIVVVTLYAGDYEWVRERVLLVGDDTPKPLVVRDLRFRAHEALLALDADEDGVDDLAARAWTPRGGGTVVLKLVDGARLERLASGFSWER